MAGFANWAPWRPKDGYRHTVEDSVYVVAAIRGAASARTCSGRSSPARATRART